MSMVPSKSVEQICAQFGAHPEARAAVREGRTYVPLLALLEHPTSEVQARLQSCLAAAGLPAEEANHISLQRLVLYALTTQDVGSYWGELAVAWVEAGFPIDGAVADALELLAQEKRFTQKSRHQSFSLAKRWRAQRSAP